MAPLPTSRNLALDVFRGLTLALMIIVNTPGSWGTQYAPLEHAGWHGFTLTDLVFPSFLFVVGGALALSMRKFAGQTDAQFLRTVFRRGALIFLCGFLLYWFPFFKADGSFMPFATTRIMGVLQRIGLCYVLAAVIVRFGGVRGAVVAAVAVLLAYWWLLWQFGDYSLPGNAARAVDLAVLGAPHMYGGDGMPFDPEGILSTLPAIANVLAGYLAIAWLQRQGRTTGSVVRMLAAGALCLLVAYAWDAALPINKKLWTGSYVACTVGWDLVILATLVWLIDLKGLRAGLPFFEVFGKNTLFIYLLSSVAVTVLARLHVGGTSLYQWLFQTVFLSWADPYLASLLFAVAYMLACWLVAYAMDRQRIYVKL
ncbi:putative acyltransferase [Pseudoduganella lurida]|uniref:Putative acyltransferase n=1 Tax=Pseudoduganella lurida TaxID=1036180 RepID=A0A562RN22_9BURK|nr:heparan-alpha-glucosaminide N-acetyltransferase domain-containing protein [Pseudoduganella lurida]TWI69826.1 putative acyltransferase [Pseudoduganella lurida]